MKKALAATLLIAVVLGPPAGASDPFYRQRVNQTWSTTKVDVIVVPPAHGPLLNEGGPLGGGGVEELSPSNSYVKATEDSIREYEKVVARHAPRWLARTLDIRTYVVGRDRIPEKVMNDPEAVITFHETMALLLGVNVSTTDPECVIANSMAFTASLSYGDMFNLNLHEFGHCLGQGHFEGPPNDPIFLDENMTPTYKHPPGGDVHLHCVSNFNLRVVVGAFAPAVNRRAPRVIDGTRDDYRLLCRR